MADDDYTYARTQAELAKVLGVSRRTVIDWIDRGAPGKVAGKGYPIEPFEEWKRELSAANGDEDDQDVNGWKRRKLIAETLEVEAKARIKGHEADTTTEDIVHLDEVDVFLSQFLTEMRRLLERLPKEMAAGYSPAVQRELEDDLTERLGIIQRAMHGWATRVTELRDDS